MKSQEQLSQEIVDDPMLDLYNGGPRVWGYRLNPERRGIPQIDNEQKGQILQIFRHYSEPDVSLRDLQKWMQAMKIVRPEYVSRNRNRCGGKVPDLSSLQNILRNTFYIGKIKYGGELHDGQHEPLFSTEEEVQIWEEVQKKLSFRSPTRNPRPARGGWKKNAKHIFVLNSLLFCSSCGSAMSHDSGTGRNGSARHYYTCVQRRKHGKESCSCPSVPADAIEDAILERLNSLSIDSSLLHQIISEADEGRSDEIVVLEDDKLNLEERLRVSRREIKGLIEVLKLDGANARNAWSRQSLPDVGRAHGRRYN